MKAMCSRGEIVACGGHYAVVWSVVADRVTLFPIEEPLPRMSGDVPIGSGDLVFFADTVIRVSRPMRRARSAWEHVGDLTPALLSRVRLAVARLTAEGVREAMWTAFRAQSEDRASACVRL